MSELDLEKRARRLVGQSLSKVLYQQAGWSGPDWRVPGHPGLHTVDLAVYLETGSGELHRIGWADEFGLHHGFGVTTKPVKVPDRDRGVMADLSDDAAWRMLLDRPIQAARIHWESVREALRNSLSIGVSICADHLRRLDYPQSLELVFDDNAAVKFDATRIDPQGNRLPFTNNLLVSFAS